MLFSKKPKYVAVTIGDEYLSCTALEVQKTDSVVVAYERVPFSYGYTTAHLFNTTACIHHVNSFLDRNRLKNSFLAISISGSPVVEHVVTLPKATHSTDDIYAIYPAFKKLCWDSRYLYTTTHGQFAFYVVGMPRELIVQYKLMAARGCWNMVLLTTSFASLLQAYIALQGDAYRRTQLAADMVQQQAFQEILTPQACARALRIHPRLTVNMHVEARYLMNAFGLIRSGVIV